MPHLASQQRLPEWLRRPPGSAESTRPIKQLLRRSALHTVCEEARCPNISECFSRGTATFMILGDVCTRGCRFCSVTTGRPQLPAASFAHEAARVADAVVELGLKHVVVTSVARDDLADGGASGFEKTIELIRRQSPQTSIEVLVPDFRGDEAALITIINARPDVLNHNLETVPRLYRRVRPGTSYERSLRLLSRAKELCPEIYTKTGIMLGLGELRDEVLQLMDDARAHHIDGFTAGQYMQPTRAHLPVSNFLSPEEFEEYARQAKSRGFRHVAVGPLVRSSYRAESFLEVREAVSGA
ncbi:MAG: lipoyl synthase [Bdellovibrionales bacterium]|nr:lipoyl synthase [Bdellovibrionales bacterium]